MAKRNYTAEQIISKLREVEVKISQGIKAAEDSEALGLASRHIAVGVKNVAVCVLIKLVE